MDALARGGGVSRDMRGSFIGRSVERVVALVRAPVTDDDLMILVSRDDDEVAFARLLERYRTRVYTLSCGLLKRAHLADEATQETFLRLWQLRSRYEPRGQFRSYLFSLCVQRCRQHNRSFLRWQRRNEAFASETTAHSSPEAFAQVSQGEERERVMERLRTLPKAQREVVMLRFYADMSYDEIALTTGVSESTLRSRLQLALTKLGKGLEEIAP